MVSKDRPKPVPGYRAPDGVTTHEPASRPVDISHPVLRSGAGTHH